MRRIYLDNNATTPVLPEVLDAMRPFFIEHFGSCKRYLGCIAEFFCFTLYKHTSCII